MEDDVKRTEECAEWHDIVSPEQYGYVCSACGCRSWNMSDTCPKCGRKMTYNGHTIQ